ncbi:fatty acyl CoA synthetase [Naegleria gruberi]|uniref:Fatty acyl CoA synthetase n=1 Tax=Naegleria gruberi TaxID=5762 RepID=D2VE90_NAEGR|nr:fatty acyl CoA synthetase [Naegleria gruberi]EFC44754.1 fatty acyl CoA synthetase [Naegleria gruberi]|eukprot:XP_002677498.1 fatty acyl CoA synthetase [Naegleria gruberi strain NEG-M]
MQKCFNLESSAGDQDFFTFNDENETDKTRNSRFAIYDDTSYDWFVTALALFKQNVTLVTIYASLGTDALIQALNESKVSGVMLNFSSLKEIVPRIAKECPRVKYILYNNRMCVNNSEEYGNGVVLTTIDELIEMGSQEKGEFKIKGTPHVSTDIQILMYTSGSTSAPKAVMITHHNVLSAVASFNCCIGVEREEEYIHIAYLPLGHILEIVVHSIILLRGGQICYGNARFLSEGTALPSGDIKFWRPSVLVGVPKVFDTIKKGAQLTLHSVAEKRGPFLGWLVNTLFKMAYSAKKRALAAGRDTPLWNKIIFKRFTDGVGGRLQLMLSGGSALIPETHEFLRICMNSVFIQGYGLTETCAGTSVANAFQTFSTGHTGPFVPCVEIRLCDVPEMGMFHKNPGGNPRGELWVRGENITLGYYKQKDLTLEAYGKLPNESSNTFFKTGDIVEILPNGSIKIIDRVKNLTKLQHGEYVALNKLESIYGDSPFVQPNGILVYADSYRDYPVALAMPQNKYLESLAKEKGISFNKVEELYTNPQILKAILQSLDKIATNSKLASYERIKAIYLCETEWTIENNMLTATQKLRRHAITEHYRDAIEKMYKP